MLRQIVALVCFFLLLAAAVTAQSPGLDAALQEMLAAPQDQWEQLLGAKSLDVTSKSYAALTLKVQTLSSKGQDADAQQLAEAVDYLAAYYDRAKIYSGRAQMILLLTRLAEKKTELANELSGKLAAAHPDIFPKNFFLYGKILGDQNPAIAILVYKHILTLAPDPPVAEACHLQMAIAYHSLNRENDSTAELKEVLKINPNNAMALDELSGWKGDKTATTTTPQAGQHFSKAEELFAKGQYRPALAEYELAIAADKNLAKAWIYKGDCHHALHEEDQAMAAYRQAIRIDPMDRQAYRFLGDVLENRYDSTGDKASLTEAISCYQKAVDISPDYNLARECLARAQAKAGR